MPHHINPSWKPGEAIEVPVNETVEIDPSTLPVKEVYKLLIGGIIPRPIAFVSTTSPEGVINAAPFSFFNGVCSNPPTLMVSIARKPDGTKKDTLRNIEATGEFVVNGANEYIAAALTHCGAAYPYGVSEVSKAGLTTLPSQKVKPPRIRESFIQFECKLDREIEIGDGGPGSSTLVLGRIELVHIEKAAYSNGRIDPSVLHPLARLGGFNFSTIGEIVPIPVPDPIPE